MLSADAARLQPAVRLGGEGRPPWTDDHELDFGHAGVTLLLITNRGVIAERIEG